MISTSTALPSKHSYTSVDWMRSPMSDIPCGWALARRTATQRCCTPIPQKNTWHMSHFVVVGASTASKFSLGKPKFIFSELTNRWVETADQFPQEAVSWRGTLIHGPSVFWIRCWVGHWVWAMPPEAISGYAVRTRPGKVASLRDRWLWRRLARSWYLLVPGW
jgi:hypothetical protein